jgi:DNA-binding NarL/FixJ family response regulator
LRGLPLRSWGLVPPDTSAAELQAAVTAAAQGLIVLAQPVGQRLLAGRPAGAALPTAEGDEPLTSREHEVLELLGQGLSNKQIARHLDISEHTVKFHVSALYAKLGAASRTDAVSRGARRGLITL